MRLFQKTLLLFITIIILLSVSTTVFITRAINTNQSVDASRELAREASSVYDNFNHWKLLLWRHINLLAEENPSPGRGPTDSFDSDLVMAVRQAASRSGSGLRGDAPRIGWQAAAGAHRIDRSSIPRYGSFQEPQGPSLYRDHQAAQYPLLHGCSALGYGSGWKPRWTCSWSR